MFSLTRALHYVMDSHSRTGATLHSQMGKHTEFLAWERLGGFLSLKCKHEHVSHKRTQACERIGKTTHTHTHTHTHTYTHTPCVRREEANSRTLNSIAPKARAQFLSHPDPGPPMIGSHVIPGGAGTTCSAWEVSGRVLTRSLCNQASQSGRLNGS